MKKPVSFYFGLWAAKFFNLGLKICGKNIPYMVGNTAAKICKGFVRYMDTPGTIIAVTGTNGKTTVASMLTDIFRHNGYKTINNTGYNTFPGIIGTLIKSTSWTGKTKYDVAILEIDEMTSDKTYSYIIPDYLICCNLFRDSAKRNAHSEFIAGIMRKAIPETTRLILNGDDIISSGLRTEQEACYFGISKTKDDTDTPPNIVRDIVYCPVCGGKLDYEFFRYHHIGRCRCMKCEYTSPKVDYDVVDVNHGKMVMMTPYGREEYRLLHDAIFNVYNMAAAVALLHQFGMDYETIRSSMEAIKLDTTRYEKKTICGIEYENLLAKGMNAVACSRVFDSLSKDKASMAVLLLIDDLHDNLYSSEFINWIYDMDCEFLNSDNIKQIILCGKRCYDYKLRCLLAGVPEDRIYTSFEEQEGANYLKLQDVSKVVLLHEVYLYDQSLELEKKIIQKIEKEAGKP